MSTQLLNFDLMARGDRQPECCPRYQLEKLLSQHLMNRGELERFLLTGWSAC